MNDRISPSLKCALAVMDQRLMRSVNTDMRRRLVRVFGRDAAVFYVDGLVSADLLQRYVIAPCQQLAGAAAQGGLRCALMNALPVADASCEATYTAAVARLAAGATLLLCDGMDGAMCLDVRFFVRRGISPPLTESAVYGPHQGFNESLRDNVTLLRRILPTPELVGEMTSVGEVAPTPLCVMYLAGAADPQSVARVRARLGGVSAEHLLSMGALAQLMEDSPHALLPQCCLTERPDRAASFLAEGQVVILMDGAPQALALPVSLFHLLNTPDDTSLRWQYGTFLRLLRLLGALCTLLLPGLFVSAVTFHPEALPVTLLTAVLESQAAVPLSIPAEMLLMLIMFNLINEAGTRVPGVAGNSLGTVSGLILGQAAVEARLIHPLLIIVVAVASLGSYAVPDYALGMALRIGQLLFVAAGAVFGVYGMVLTMLVCVVRACALRSLGSPLLAPLAPQRPHNPDVLLRLPLWRQRLRTWLGNPEEMERVRGPMRRWDRT